MNLMNDAIETSTEIISKILQVTAEMLGLQRSAGSVLASLYLSDFEAGERLSSKDISNSTGLSRSMVSMVLSQMQSLDIIDTHLDASKKGGGRRTMLFSLRMGIHDLLKMVIQKYIEQIHRILNDLEQTKNQITDTDDASPLVLDRVMSELVLFLADPFGI